MAAYKTLRVELTGEVLTVTLDRPEVHNVLSCVTVWYKAASSSLSVSTTRCTSPMRNARSASNRSPVRNSVRAQLEVASGEPVPWTQAQIAQRGHAIEVRLYAEDPDDRFLPQSGTIAPYREPGGQGARVDV